MSWLPGRVLSGGQAEAAMLIAQTACDVDAGCDPDLRDAGFWSRLDGWAGQRGMPGPAALAQAAAPPAGELTPRCRTVADVLWGAGRTVQAEPAAKILPAR